MSQLFTSGGQSFRASASASVLPVNIQGWFPLGLTSLISLLPRGLSKVFSSTAIWKHQFFGTQPSLWSYSHICTWLLEKPLLLEKLLEKSLWSAVSAEKAAGSVMGIPLHVICCYSLAASKVFSLPLIFVILITMCLGVLLFGLILHETLCDSWPWVTVSFPMLGKFSSIMSSLMFSVPCSFISSVGHL